MSMRPRPRPRWRFALPLLAFLVGAGCSAALTPIIQIFVLRGMEGTFGGDRVLAWSMLFLALMLVALMGTVLFSFAYAAMIWLLRGAARGSALPCALAGLAYLLILLALEYALARLIGERATLVIVIVYLVLYPLAAGFVLPAAGKARHLPEFPIQG